MSLSFRAVQTEVLVGDLLRHYGKYGLVAVIAFDDRDGLKHTLYPLS
jgi:hypothetical protein